MLSQRSLISKFNATFEFAEIQLRNLIDSFPDQFPMYTKNGKWHFSGETWTNWCEGFLGGQLWLIFEHNQDPWWREKAEHYSRLIEYRKSDRTVHDLGFLFWPTYKRWYDLCGDPSLKSVLVEAGRTMSLRFRDQGLYLRSFLAEDSLFIDIMMNVGGLFFMQPSRLTILKCNGKPCSIV
jgi:unsaturated chondroitin disaccharide hydrolase